MSKKKRDPESEASIATALKYKDEYEWSLEFVPLHRKNFDVHVKAINKSTKNLDALIKVSEFIKKRKPLTGIGKKLKEAVRLN